LKKPCDYHDKSEFSFNEIYHFDWFYWFLKFVYRLYEKWFISFIFCRINFVKFSNKILILNEISLIYQNKIIREELKYLK
jgi:hypothetical protein